MTIGDEFAAHKLGESATDRARGYVLKAGQDLYAKQDEITSGMAVVLAAEIELIGGDQPLIEQLKRSIRSNVTTLFHGLANEIPIEKIEAPGGAVDYARSLAQRSIPASHLIRAYAIGQNYLLESAFDEVRRGGRARRSRIRGSPANQRISLPLHRLGLPPSRQNSRRGAESVVPAVLRTPVDPSAADRRRNRPTQVRTRNGLPTHCQPPRDDPVGASHRGGRSDTRRHAQLHSHTRKCMRRCRTSAGTDDRQIHYLDLDAGCSGIDRARELDLRARVDKAGLYRLAVGVPARDADGFVKSHRLAAKAQSVAMAAASEAERMITCYDDQGVRVASLVVGQLELTRAWVGEVLGQLAKDDDAAAVLRETCRIFLQTGDNYVRTAELLNVHRNTVKYRLGKIPPSHVGHGIETDRITVAVALELCHLLGSRVLEPS